RRERGVSRNGYCRRIRVGASGAPDSPPRRAPYPPSFGQTALDGNSPTVSDASGTPNLALELNRPRGRGMVAPAVRQCGRAAELGRSVFQRRRRPWIRHLRPFFTATTLGTASGWTLPESRSTIELCRSLTYANLRSAFGTSTTSLKRARRRKARSSYFAPAKNC